ncbi:MAG: HEAT repeat domain-containing protein [Acidobacteria bacterium]|nr:HEAT repeat domain-containing protein [Acidobacteriota bacterium]
MKRGLLVLLAGWAIACAPARAQGASPAPAADLERLFASASLWEVGTNTGEVRAAREALAARGDEAIAFVLARKIAAETTLEQRAIDELFGRVKEQAAPRVLAAMQDEARPAARVNLARLARLLEIKQAVPVLVAWAGAIDEAGEQRARRLAAQIAPALAALDPARAFEVAWGWQAHRDPWVRVAAVRALGATGSPDAAAALAGIAGGGDTLLVRGAAALALVEFGPRAAPALEQALAACAAVDAKAPRCAFLVRAAADLARSRAGTPEEQSLRRALEKVAALGPPALSRLTVALAFGEQLGP